MSTSAKRKPSSERVIKRSKTSATAKKQPAKKTSTLDNLKAKFSTAVGKVVSPRKSGKKMTKLEREMAKKQRVDVIMGICMLLVVVSITYSTYMVSLFVDGTAMVIALAPQVVFAVITLVLAFSKIYK